MLIFLGIVALILLLLSIPVAAEVSVAEGETTVKVKYLFLSFVVFPAKEKEEKPKKAKKKDAKPKPKAPKKEKLKFSIEEIIEIAVKGLESTGIILRSVFKAITIKKLKLDIIVAKAGASETAQEYGRIHAYIGGAYAFLVNFIKIKDPQIIINADFYSKTPRQSLFCVVNTRLIGIIGGFIAGAAKFFVFFVKNMALSKDKNKKIKAKA